MILKEKLAAQIPVERERVKKLLAESGDVVVDDVTIRQVYGGMRGVKNLVSDISYVDPNEGIRFWSLTYPTLIRTKASVFEVIPFLNYWMFYRNPMEARFRWWVGFIICS